MFMKIEAEVQEETLSQKTQSPQFTAIQPLMVMRNTLKESLQYSEERDGDISLKKISQGRIYVLRLKNCFFFNEKRGIYSHLSFLVKFSRSVCSKHHSKGAVVLYSEMELDFPFSPVFCHIRLKKKSKITVR